MIPNQSLVQPPIWSFFQAPQDQSILFTTDVAVGGIALSDPSQGLQYQDWYGYVFDPGLSTSAVYLYAGNTPATLILSSPGITWMRFTFDQNMHPFVSFVDNTGSHFFWWDPTIPGNTTTNLTGSKPACTLDDPRAIQTRLGNNDIILAYINNNNLCYRQQRDRYGIEYTLYTNIQDLIANPFVNRVAMNVNWRLQFEIGGQLYQ